MPTMRRFLMTLIPIALVAGCGASKQHLALQQQAENLPVELAEIYIAKGAPEAAIPLLRRIVAERPRDVKVRVMYATVLRDLGLYPQAQAQFGLALKLDPSYAPAHAGLGILYDLMRDSARAQRHHKRAVELAPGVAAFHNNLGFSLYLTGDTDGAIRELETALALDPALAIAYNNLGFAYGRRGEFDKAERSFRVVSDEPQALVNLSLVYDQAGQPERARALRERAYALAPDLRPDEEIQ